MANADDARTAPDTPIAADLRPPASIKFFYSIGQVVESGYLATNGFIFFYYTAVLGLSGSMVGAALAISLCAGGCAHPPPPATATGARRTLPRYSPNSSVRAA